MSFFLLLLLGSELPLFGVCTWIGVLHHKAVRRYAGVGIRSRLSSAARLVRGPGGTSIVPYVYNLFAALHLWCYFIAGGLPGVILAGGGLLHDREVVVPSLRQPRSQERFPLSVFKGMNTDPSVTLHRHSIDLGFGYRRYGNFVFYAPYPNTSHIPPPDRRNGAFNALEDKGDR